jgi:hypothetical protein
MILAFRINVSLNLEEHSRPLARFVNKPRWGNADVFTRVVVVDPATASWGIFRL